MTLGQAQFGRPLDSLTPSLSDELQRGSAFASCMMLSLFNPASKPFDKLRIGCTKDEGDEVNDEG
jgi:hypothetical protein